MTNPTVKPTAELVEKLTEQVRRYEDVRDVVERLAPDGQLGPAQQHLLRQIESMMAKATAGERDVAFARKRWQQAGSPRSPELLAVVQTHEKLLVRLIEKIDALQQGYCELRDALAPQIDSHNYEGKVVAAYRRVLTSS